MARPVCLIAEPIHPVGEALLADAGLRVRHASQADLTHHPQALADVHAIIVRNALPAEAMDAAPRLAVIANHGTGTDAVDTRHALALGIPVVYTPTTNVRAVAEHALMLMLATARQAVLADAATRRGKSRAQFGRPLLSLFGKTLLVLGFGHTGQHVAGMAAGLGMRVIVWSPRTPPGVIEATGASAMPDLDEALGQADVVSMHRPLRADTRHTLDARALATLKPGAIVINTSRGGLIDEQALAECLRSGHVFGAGLDVLEHEPMHEDSPLAGLSNVVLSPHVAGSTQEALHDTARACALQIIDVLAGRRPAHLVSPDGWERRRQRDPLLDR